ncbi:MAG: glycosyltransferase family 2 protein [Candidatus Kapabacteria bacterium]|nr:glycosyltransferase family 2 protein [Candidatus Kapabacteria bacterium]
MSSAVIIPALNEEASIGRVVVAVREHVGRVVVVDNGSTDATAKVARAAGAHVVHQQERGYGAACLRGIEELAKDPPDVVVFVDGDFSDHPDDVVEVRAPVLRGDADLVIGSRVRGTRERGALTPQQVFGNWLATTLIRLRWNVAFTDLGPLRAVRWTTLMQMQMTDRNYGWTVEMQIKAARDGVRCLEVPVRYRRRIGKSKVSGTVKGTIMAGVIILRTIAQHALR